MIPDTLVHFLPWDSDFFGKRIASIDSSRLCKEDEPTIESWCRDNRIDCLYFLADSSDTTTIRVAEDSGFRLVDIRITLDLKICATPSAWQPETPSIRLAVAADIPLLRPIAAVNHRNSRFYQDGGFPLERCDELYAVWIQNSCRGYSDAVLVATQGDSAVGYLSCHLRGGEKGQIGLVGVSSACQGKGVGRQLLAESLRWFAAAGVTKVEVVTQGRNLAAQRLYLKSGFLPSSLQLWYHKWFLHG